MRRQRSPAHQSVSGASCCAHLPYARLLLYVGGLTGFVGEPGDGLVEASEDVRRHFDGSAAVGLVAVGHTGSLRGQSGMISTNVPTRI